MKIAEQHSEKVLNLWDKIKNPGAKMNTISECWSAISIYVFYNEGLTVLCAKICSSTLEVS